MNVRRLVVLNGICLLIGVALAAESPSKLPLKPPKHGGVYVVAHRGAHEGIPENTLPAYQKAIDLGADFVEIDARTTKDGKLVSIHNGEVDAYVKDVKGPVKSFTLEQLRALDIGSRVGPQWKGTKIPTVEEAMDLCKGKIGVYLDMKDAPVAQIVSLLKERGMEHDALWYADPAEIKQMRELCPECIEMPDPGPEANLPKLLETLKPRVVASVWKFYSEAFADACHKAGAIVIVDESGPTCWQQAIDWGTDGIQTDHPADLIKMLDARKK